MSYEMYRSKYRYILSGEVVPLLLGRILSKRGNGAGDRQRFFVVSVLRLQSSFFNFSPSSPSLLTSPAPDPSSFSFRGLPLYV